MVAAAAAALAVRSASQCLLAVSAPAYVHRQLAAGATVLGGTRRRATASNGRLRALPPELSEILSPKLVPGSPSDTGDVSSLIPVSAVMLLFYFVSNWVVPELLMKGLKSPAENDAAASTQQGDAAKKKKKKKKKKSTSIKEETSMKV